MPTNLYEEIGALDDDSFRETLNTLVEPIDGITVLGDAIWGNLTVINPISVSPLVYDIELVNELNNRSNELVASYQAIYSALNENSEILSAQFDQEIRVLRTEFIDASGDVFSGGIDILAGAALYFDNFFLGAAEVAAQLGRDALLLVSSLEFASDLVSRPYGDDSEGEPWYPLVQDIYEFGDALAALARDFADGGDFDPNGVNFQRASDSLEVIASQTGLFSDAVTELLLQLSQDRTSGDVFEGALQRADNLLGSEYPSLEALGLAANIAEFFVLGLDFYVALRQTNSLRELADADVSSNSSEVLQTFIELQKIEVLSIMGRFIEKANIAPSGFGAALDQAVQFFDVPRILELDEARTEYGNAVALYEGHLADLVTLAQSFLERAGYAETPVALEDDGPEQTELGLLLDSDANSLGGVAIDAPTFISDGTADYRVTLGGLVGGVQYNIAYIIDVSGSMGGQRIADAKNAYIELTNQLIDLGIADVANFAVIPFTSGSTLYADLTAEQAIDLISSLNAGGGTSFGPALSDAESFFSSANPGQTNIAYFLSDGQGSGASDSLTDIANVQAFGIGSGANLSSLNIIDSDNAVALSSSSQLVDVLTGSSVDATIIDRVEITLNGQLVETISPEQLVDGPRGLEYAGTLTGLDIGASAENAVLATVYLIDGSVGGQVDLSIASALNGTSEVSDGNTTDIVFGAVSTSFDTASVNTPNVDILGNNLDNTIVSSGVGGTFSSFGGNDLFLLGNYANSTVDRVIDGGSGYDAVEYEGNYDPALVSTNGSVIRVGSNTDTITNVEEIRFSDLVLDTETFTLSPRNAPPVAFNDAFSVDAGDTLSGNLLADNGNGADTDPDGGGLRISLLAGPSDGVLTLNEDGSFTYEAVGDVFELALPGNVVERAFLYQITDDDGASAVASATVSVAILEEEEQLNEVLGTTGRDYLVGTDADDVFIFKGGYGDAAVGNGGNDHFDLSENLVNGVVDNTRIIDWSEGDMLIGIDADDINLATVRSSSTALRFAYGDDNDVLTVTGDVSGGLESLFGSDQIA